MKKIMIILIIIALFSSMAIISSGCKEPEVIVETITETVIETVEIEVPAEEDSNIVVIGEYEFEIGKAIEDLEIAVVYMNVSVPFSQFIKAGVDAAAEEFGVNAYLTGPTSFSTEEQYAVMENLISKRVDGMSAAVLDIPGLTPIIQQALEAGIPTTCNNVDAPDSGRLGFVGEDLYLAGAETAKEAARLIDGKGKILISGWQLDAIWSIKRQQGVEDVLSEYPDIEVVDIVQAGGDEQQAYAALENALLAYPDIDAHVSLGGTGYIFGRLCKNEDIGNINSDNPIYTTGHDLYEEKLLQIQDGWQAAAYGQNPFEQGYQAVKMFVDFYSTGDPSVFKVIDTGVFKVDQSNVQEYLDKLAAGEPVG